MSEPTPVVRLKGPDGRLVEADASDVVALVDSGRYAVASADDEAAFQQRQGYGDQGGRAFLEGTARGASFGLSDAVQAEGAGIGTELGNYVADLAGYGPTEQAVDGSLDAAAAPIDRAADEEKAFQEARAGLLGRQQANTAAATGGELLGGLGLAVATGGLGTSGLAARGTSALGKAGYAALAGGLEGAAYGAAKAADDDFLADREITAERILLGAGEGLILGGALGGSMSLLGTGAKYAAGKAADALGGLGRRLGVTRAADETVESLMTKAEISADAQARMAARDEVASAAAAEAESALGMQTDDALSARMAAESEAGLSFELTPTVDPVAQQEARGALIASGLKDDGRTIYQQARAAEGGFENAQQSATREISSDLKTFIRGVDQLDVFGGIAAKRRASEMFNMPGMKIGMQEVAPLLEQTRARVRDLMSSEIRKEALKSGGGYTVVSRVDDMLNAVERDVGAAFARGDIGDGYMMLDQGLKKTMQQAAKSRNPLVAEVFNGESDKVRMFLEDESIWGDLARRQKTANPAWTERIRREGDADVGGFFKRSGDASADPFEVLDKPNEATIGGLLNRLGDAESEGAEEAFRRYLRATTIDAETRAAAWGTTELRKQAATIRTAAEKIERRMDEVALMRRDAAAWSEVKKTVESVPFAGAALKGVVSLTQRAAGFAESRAQRTASMSARGSSGSAANAASERIIDMQARGASMAEVNAARRSAVVQGAKDAAARGETSLATSAANFVRKASSGLQAKAARAVETVPIAGVILRPGDAGSYEDAVQQLLRLQDAASNERRKLQERNAELAAESPEHAAAIDAHVQRTADFLVDKAGPSGADVSRPFANLRKPKHDRGKAQTLARYARAAQNPQAALGRVSDGTYTREDLETLQELYPRLWARFGGKVRAELATLEKPPTYKARLALSQVLGQPMTAFDTPAFQEIMNASRGTSDQAEAEAQAQMAGPGQQTVSPSNVSVTPLMRGNVYAGSDRAIARGE